jgi:DNA-binding transcriptional LysR family regulator
MARIGKTKPTRDYREMNLESFDLNLLRVLDALLVARSVSGAARRLDLSQPATSAALARLRHALADPLLVRSGNQMVTTPLAEELRPRVARVLEEIGQTLNAAATFDAATTRRRFRIGANDYTALVLLGPLVARLRQLAPHAILEILPCDGMLNAGVEAALATRELDVAITDRWSLRGIRTAEEIFQETFVSIARADHSRLGRRVTLDQFLAEDHALISPRGVAPGNLDHALEALGRSRRVALTVPHYVVAPMIVAHTDLIMTLPRRIAESFARAHRLRTFAPPVKLDGFDVVMAFHPRAHAEPQIQWLKSLIHAVAAQIK